MHVCRLIRFPLLYLACLVDLIVGTIADCTLHVQVVCSWFCRCGWSQYGGMPNAMLIRSFYGLSIQSKWLTTPRQRAHISCTGRAWRAVPAVLFNVILARAPDARVARPGHPRRVLALMPKGGRGWSTADARGGHQLSRAPLSPASSRCCRPFSTRVCNTFFTARAGFVLLYVPLASSSTPHLVAAGGVGALRLRCEDRQCAFHPYSQLAVGQDCLTWWLFFFPSSSSACSLSWSSPFPLSAGQL